MTSERGEVVSREMANFLALRALVVSELVKHGGCGSKNRLESKAIRVFKGERNRGSETFNISRTADPPGWLSELKGTEVGVAKGCF